MMTDEFITFILGSNTETFTPVTVLAVFALCLVLDCIATILGECLRVK